MSYELILGDCLEKLRGLADNSVQCIVSSPPYFGLRDYGSDGQIGLEQSPEAYIAKLVEVFGEARRVLKDNGTLWLNLGDSYSTGAKHRPVPDGLKSKDLMFIPHKVAIALQADGWWARSDIVWNKPNPMPESVTDRPTKAHESIFLLTKSARYFYDNEAVREANSPTGMPFGASNSTKQRDLNDSKGERLGRNSALGPSSFENRYRLATQGRNRRSVWTVDNSLAEFLAFAKSQGIDLIEVAKRYANGNRELADVFDVATKPFKESHFATFPPKLIEPCILAGTSEAGECPFCGKAWVRVVEREGKTKRQLLNEIGGANYHKVNGNGLNYKGGHNLPERQSTTIGFTPQCQCPPHAPVPQTVLDPFNGAGTSGVVALRHGRNYIGIELNPEYLEMSRKRLQNYAIEMPDELTQPKVIKQQIAMF